MPLVCSEAKPMSQRLLDVLACPVCLGHMQVTRGDGVDGQLHCQSAHRFAVIGGVPRMFVGGPTPELAERHRDYFSRNPELLDAGADAHDALAKIKARTSQAFGYEWTEFSDYAADNYDRMLGPALAHDVAGERVLEIGCGAGRHAVRTASRGAEVFALDYSLAVESAAKATRELPNVHVIQGDVYHLPFRTGQFDCAYSLGVLHHLPSPEGGFREMVTRVRPGGTAFIWVYKRTLRKVLFEPFRKPFALLPPPTLKRVARMAAVVDYGVFCNLYRLVHAGGSLGRLAARAFPNRIREYAGYDFHVSYTDWYDRLSAPIVRVYSESDIGGWLERAGLRESVVTSQADFGVRGYGRVTTEAP